MDNGNSSKMPVFCLNSTCAKTENLETNQFCFGKCLKLSSFRYRRKHGHGSDPCFGMNMLLDFPGMIAVGDPVYVISKDADSQ